MGYQLYGQLPQVQPFIYGVKSAIIAVIVVTMILLGRKALKSVQLEIIGVTSAVAVLIGFNEIYVLFGAGFIGILLKLIFTGCDKAAGIMPFGLLQIEPVIANSSYLPAFKLFLLPGGAMLGYILSMC